MNVFKLKVRIVVFQLITMCIFFLFIACSGNKQIFTPSESTQKTVTIKEIVRDTLFKIQPDSSLLQALIECQGTKAVIKEITQSKAGESSLQAPKVQLKENLLRVDCQAKAQELLASWKENHKEQTQIITRKEYVPVEKKLTQWQTLYLTLGKFVFFLGIGFLLFSLIYLIKWGLKIKKLK